MKNGIFIDGKKDMVHLLQKRVDKNAYVGELPGVIFYALPKENKGDIIREIYKAFENCAIQIRNFKVSQTLPTDEINNRRPKSVVDGLKAVLVKYGVLKEADNFDIKYIGAGEYKKAYKLVGLKDPKNNEELCFKVFHIIDKSPEWHKYKCHGNYSELNIATYWKKNVGRYTQRNKFFFGDINNGYLVDRYVDNSVPKPSKIINEYDYGVKITDEVNADSGHNKIAGISIDEGGSRVVNRIKNKSKIARYVLKIIKNTPQEERLTKWTDILENWKHLDEIQRKAGLALSVKHMTARNQIRCIEKSLSFNEPMVDQSLAYALKYIPDNIALEYFEILMKRNDPLTQTILLNEIPLLSKTHANQRMDDIDTLRGDIKPTVIAKYYNIAKEFVLPEVREHLASYVHLLPKNRIQKEAKYLISQDNYDIYDRMLHKIKFVGSDQFSNSDKIEIIEKIKQNTDNEFILKKAEQIRIKLIRDSLED